MKNADNTSLLFDLDIFGRRKAELLKMLEKWFNEGDQLHLVYTPNPEQIVQSRGNKDFKQVLQQADLLLPDGIGLVFAARFLSIFGKAKPIAERITGVSIVADLLKLAKEKDLEVLVVGGREYSPSDYFAYQGLKVHWQSGYQDVRRPTSDENKQLQAKIKEIKPDIVFVAFGAPFQELWLAKNKNLLEKNKVKLGMAVGGSFDYLLDKISRAPYWMRKIGLEWIFRLIIEPWRIKRQLRLVSFMFLIIKTLFKK